jgi:hypothetical protein
MNPTLAARPLRDRRARLEDAVAGSELVFPVRRLAADGPQAWKQVVERGYEGVRGEGRVEPVRRQLAAWKPGSGPGSTVNRPTGVSRPVLMAVPYLGTIWIWFLILS